MTTLETILAILLIAMPIAFTCFVGYMLLTTHKEAQEAKLSELDENHRLRAAIIARQRAHFFKLLKEDSAFKIEEPTEWVESEHLNLFGEYNSELNTVVLKSENEVDTKELAPIDEDLAPEEWVWNGKDSSAFSEWIKDNWEFGE